ncbi:NAD(P)-dependent oxidoreductase [Agrococcus sp. Ld7]|uniref:NAD(P)-dependent oxidoreductase n=1 Tax=Agrococcus sp. Ld7 TaxID=649148 RepID=UPI003864841C
MKIVHPDGSQDEREELERALQEHNIPLDDVEVHYGAPANADEWVERVGDAELVMLGWSLPDAALERFPAVRGIVFLGTGAADHVNLALAHRLGIEVRTVTGYGDDSVAEHALALLLAMARRIPEHDAQVREGEWGQFAGTMLRGKTAGVVGLGGIGRRFAQLAAGIGMDVIGWNRSAEQGERIHDSGIPLVPLDALCKRADVVSLHLALNADTEGIISAERIDAMAAGTILVNTARGGVVDEAAVRRRTDAGELRYAADVFDPEPLPADSPQRQSPNTVLTPHVGFFTPEATLELYRGACAHIATLLAKAA